MEEKYVPKKTIICNSQRKGNFPMSAKTRKLIWRKDRLWTRYIETRDGQKYVEYCKARNKVRALTRKLRKEFEKHVVSQMVSNNKLFWQYYKSKLTIKQGIGDFHENPIELKSATTSDDERKANILANYFSSVLTEEDLTNMPILCGKEINEQMPDCKITKSMVLATLQKLKANKSPGPDEIHPKLLIETAEQISYPLQTIFATSLRTHTVPTDWKNGRISAIHKKGNRKLASNYRPISLTCILCKCMESIIRSHIVQHMKLNKLFSSKQYGFISGRSTVMQLLNVMDIWTKALDDDQQIDIIYMDFQKAFDKVPHQRILIKLHSYGIHPELIDWIEGFLLNRVQKVVVNGKESVNYKVTSGIPQGSVLGPLLFTIYINDLPETTRSNTFLFADDTKIFRQITNDNDHLIIQEDLNALTEWSNEWQLKFHPDKCKQLTIGGKKNDLQTYYMQLEGVLHNLQVSAEETGLGVTIDSKLTFDTHISNKINKATQMTRIIRRTFQFLDMDTFSPVYKCMVRPHLDYANSIWYPNKKTHNQAIENVHKRATKQLPGFHNLSYSDRLKKLRLPTLTYRRLRGDMIETYKIINNIYDKESCPKLSRCEDIVERTGNRGHPHKLYKLRPKKNH